MDLVSQDAKYLAGVIAAAALKLSGTQGGPSARAMKDLRAERVLTAALEQANELLSDG